MGAIDVNFDAAELPEGRRAIDPIRGPVEKLGFFVIWRATDHFDHMHIDPVDVRSAPAAPAASPARSRTCCLDVRLVDWDDEIDDARRCFGSTARRARTAARRT